MNILLLNWRDRKNPQAGGAELLTHELAKRWVEKGHNVTHLTSSFDGSAQKEIIDGVHIVRHGKWWNIHAYAFILYMLRYRKWADIVVDEVHWFPFFSALYAQKKTVLLACETATDLFPILFPYPIYKVLQIAEWVYFYLYKRIPTIAISTSTKNALISRGFTPENICVIPLGITRPNKDLSYSKHKLPTILFTGRLTKLKGTDDAVKMLSIVHKKIPDATLWFVGSGNSRYIRHLEKQIHSLGLSRFITFFGFVTQDVKFKLMAQAHVLIAPSVQEGWGLVVHEAGFMGTPSVVYDVHGLRDIVKHRINGMLVQPNPESLATSVIGLLSDSVLYRKIQKGAKDASIRYDWSDTASSALEHIESIYEKTYKKVG